MGCLLGIDVGTTGTKTLLCNDEGDILASTTAEHPSYHPKPGWSEQNPEDWWRGTVESVGQVIREAGVSGREVNGIGLSGQMHGAVLLDKSQQVLRPAILWNDQRTARECEEITERVGRARLIELTCNPALTGFTAPKILWVRKHEPDIYKRAARILLPKDYVRFRMTGAFATEVSDASGTLLLDVPRRRWSDEVLNRLEVDKSLLPDCFESPEVSAKVTREAAEAMGIPEGTAVVGGGGDQAAGAVGNGIVERGVISATLGTSGVVFAFSEAVEKDPMGRVHTFCHAVPGKWHVMGVMLAAGGSFQWYRNNLAAVEMEEAKKRGVDPYDVLCEIAAGADPGSEGLFFLPYLTGERTPHANPNARGGWIGLASRHTKAHLIRALLEGVTFGMRDSLEIIKGMGIPIRQIRASGGGARSEFWRQMMADVFNHPVVTINATEGPAYGVALLAGVGTGAFSSVEEACRQAIKVVSETKPTPRSAAAYEKAYPVYGGLYKSLKEDFDRISRLVTG